jgi:hypothetical protein
MDVTVFGQKIFELGENPQAVFVINMVEEAIYQDEVVQNSWRRFIARHIRDDKFSAEATPCIINVRLAPIQTQIFGVAKATRIGTGATADVEDSACLIDVIVLPNWSQFLLCERRLP